MRAVRRVAALVRTVLALRADARRIDRRTDVGLQRRGRAYALSRACAQICRAHGVHVNVSGQVPAGPVVLVANHVGDLAPIALASVVPCFPVSKYKIGRWPLFGRAARLLRVALVERGNVSSGVKVLRSARRALDAGVSVLGFPEGTATSGSEILPFRRGIFGVARIARTPVVPVLISTEPASLGGVGERGLLPHYLRIAAREASTVHIRFGPALTPRRYGSAADLAEEAADVIAHMLAEA